MKNETDILSDPSLRKNPFSVPEGYALSLEDRVHERIAADYAHSQTFSARAKAPALLALTFCIIFAMGYGVLSVTGSLEKAPVRSVTGFAELIENGYISSDFIEDYYDEMPSEAILDEAFSSFELTEEIEEEILKHITLKDIIGDY